MSHAQGHAAGKCSTIAKWILLHQLNGTTFKIIIKAKEGLKNACKLSEKYSIICTHTHTQTHTHTYTISDVLKL